MLSRPVRIVIVEDEPQLIRSLGRQLQALGHTDFHAVRSESEAIQIVERERPDLVIMDVNLGAGGDGARAATTIRQTWGIPSLFLTAHADDETLERCKLAEPAGYLLKPFTPELLRITLEMALHRERVLQERAHAEQERRRAESLFVAILENAPIAVLATIDNRVVSSNPAAQALYGRNAEELQGLEIVELLRTESARVPSTARYQACAPVEGGEIPVMVNRADLGHHSENLASYFVQDLRDRLALESQLNQAQRSQAVSLLASGVAHDFNNLLGALQTLLFLIEMESGDRAGFLQVKDLERAIERGSWLTKELAQLGRHTDREPELIDLGQHVSSMEQLLRRIITREIALEVTHSIEPTPIRISTAQLQHLLLSLLMNAQEAIVDRGQLKIRISQEGDFARLDLIDSGRGMTAEVERRAFEPFFTTKPAGAGLGLGLPTVRRSMEALGGSVELVSVAKSGTTATLRFPLAGD